MVKNSPKLSDLLQLIKNVPTYPVSADELVDIAKENHAAPEVVDFYKDFHGGLTFHDQDELVATSEQLKLMRQEDSPKEIMTAPEED